MEAEPLMAALAKENTGEYFTASHQSFASSPDSWIVFPFPWRVPEPFCSVFHLLAGPLGHFLLLATHPTGCPGSKSLGRTLSPSLGTFVASPGAQGPHPAAPQGCSAPSPPPGRRGRAPALRIFWECVHPCALQRIPPGFSTSWTRSAPSRGG